jgi:hypothetical protein
MLDDIAVFVRIALWVLAGKLIAGGWLPEDVRHLVTSPEMVEAFSALILGSGTAVWYWFSKSHRALQAVKKSSHQQL